MLCDFPVRSVYRRSPERGPPGSTWGVDRARSTMATWSGASPSCPEAQGL